jgi:hypothetical protein
VQPVLYASRQWPLEALPETCRVRITACAHCCAVMMTSGDRARIREGGFVNALALGGDAGG